ncbi:MAG: DNA polymerase [Actinomycetota bacterium]|nr:DNA polymerase [Actinomycetota bacterium]
MLPDLLAADALGVDLETAGDGKDAALDPRRGRIRLVQLATREQTYVIDAFAVDVSALAPLFDGASGPPLVGHNLGFDLGFLHAAGLPIPPGDRLFDTMLASQLLDGGRNLNTKVPDPCGGAQHGKPATVGYHTLAAVAHRVLGAALDKAHQTSDWSGELTHDQLGYAARDAAVLPPLRDALDFALAEDGLERVAALEFAALPAVVWMEATGVPLDVPAWTALRDAAAVELVAAEAELAAALPGVKPDSPTQLIAALASLGVDVANVQEATLSAVANRHPAVGLVLRRKLAKKKVATYGDGYLKHVRDDGRIHAGYRLIGAASGRMACGSPNMQNIPRDPDYRRCVRPAPGRVLIKADYSQIELRIAAAVSGDEAMLAAFREGEDLHAKTARAVLGHEPSKQDRQLAKALNFGLLYGMGAPRLRAYAQNDYGVALSEADATRFRVTFFDTYAGLRRWHRSHPDGALDTRTLAGRLRRGVENYTEKLNTPVQGTGADMIKLALGRLWADRAAAPSAVPVLVVHDEIVLEVDAADAEAAAAWITAHMHAAGAELLSDVPVAVEAEVVADWSGTPVASPEPPEPEPEPYVETTR